MIKTLTSENLNMSQKLKSAEAQLSLKDEQEKSRKALKRDLEKLLKNKDKYKSDLEICTNYLLEVEERCQEAQNISLDLLAQMKAKDQEISMLK